MPQTILVQSPVMERANQNYSSERISQTVDCRLMRFLLARSYGGNKVPSTDTGSAVVT